MNRPPGVCIIPVINNDYNNNGDGDDQSSTISDDNYDNDLIYKTFISRPKCRLWEVNEIGQIEFTHQFMELVNRSTTVLMDNNNTNNTPIFNGMIWFYIIVINVMMMMMIKDYISTIITR